MGIGQILDVNTEASKIFGYVCLGSKFVVLRLAKMLQIDFAADVPRMNCWEAILT